MKKYYHRVTIALDSNSFERLKELSNLLGYSLSNVIRNAIEIYYQICRYSNLSVKNAKNLDSKKLRNWITTMMDGQHVIIDKEHWNLLFEKIENNDISSDIIYTKIKDSGFAHGIEFALDGDNTPLKVLQRLELGGWGHVLQRDEDTYIFVITGGRGTRFVKSFLEGIFHSQDINVKITSGVGKLIIHLYENKFNKSNSILNIQKL